MWDLLWEVRLQKMEGLGKREAILTASRLVRELSADRPGLRLFEPGCGEGQILGTLVDAHPGECARDGAVGIDYLRSSIETCRRNYPGVRFIEGDFTNPALVSSLGSFDLILLVNALHEVFSAAFSEQLGETDVQEGKLRVAQAFSLAVERLSPGGYVVLFDGLEPPGDPNRPVRVRFRTALARKQFDTFTREYHPFQIQARPTRDPFVVEMSQHDFTRYIDKSIFLGKRLWDHERFESYQYYTEVEFRAMFARCGLEITSLRTLTENFEKWNEIVELEDEDFPEEHVIIIGKKTENG